jgi:tripartite-type tricarboxylate transporter receptor subunit TctC
LTLLVPLIQEGKLKGLAVQASQRWPALPDVPTLSEAGLGDFPGNAWAGIMAPPKTPQPIVDKINATINEILQSPDTKAALANLNVLLRPGTPQDFRAFMAKGTPAWSEMARESGASAH